MLKYDGLTKKSRDLLFWCFLKDLTQYHTHGKFHSLVVTGSGFMEGETKEYVKKAQSC